MIAEALRNAPPGAYATLESLGNHDDVWNRSGNVWVSIFKEEVCGIVETCGSCVDLTIVKHSGNARDYYLEVANRPTININVHVTHTNQIAELIIYRSGSGGKSPAYISIPRAIRIAQAVLAE